MDTLNEAAPQATKSSARGGVDLRRIGLVWTILLVPIETGIALYLPDIRTSGYASTFVLMLFDIPLLVLTAGALPSIVSRVRTRDFSLGVATVLFLTAAALVTLPFHPSRSGAGVVFRLAFAAVVAFEISGLSARAFRYRVGAPLLIGAAIQSTLGVMQVLNGGAIGLNRIGERSAFFEFGDVVGAQGTMLHPYVLAGYAILAATVGIATLPDGGQQRKVWLVGIGLAAVPLGITFSRSGAVGAIIVLGLLAYGAYRNRERYGAALIAMGVGALVPALLFSGGWLDRFDDSTRDGLDRSSSGRVTLIQQSFDLIESSPIVGVGPGRYAIVMEEDPTVLPQVVHNVPLLLAAESGIVVGLAALVLLLLLGYRALRTSIAAAVVAAGLGVWMVFDKFTYLSPNGLVMFAIWLGVLDWLWTHRDTTEAA